MREKNGITSNRFNSQSRKCSRCNVIKTGIKKLDLWNLPPVLTLQLKRFEVLHTEQGKGPPILLKTDAAIDYGLNLDLNPFLMGEKDGVYALIGVIVRLFQSPFLID